MMRHDNWTWRTVRYNQTWSDYERKHFKHRCLSTEVRVCVRRKWARRGCEDYTHCLWVRGNFCVFLFCHVTPSLFIQRADELEHVWVVKTTLEITSCKKTVKWKDDNSEIFMFYKSKIIFIFRYWMDKECEQLKYIEMWKRKDILRGRQIILSRRHTVGGVKELL